MAMLEPMKIEVKMVDALRERLDRMEAKLDLIIANMRHNNMEAVKKMIEQRDIKVIMEEKLELRNQLNAAGDRRDWDECNRIEEKLKSMGAW